MSGRIRALSKPWFTLFLVVVNCGFFIAEEWAGGSSDTAVLISLGAKAGALIWEGEYWRIAGALFLHKGPSHLLMNLAFLLCFGTIIEVFWGPRRFLAIYLSSGITGNLLSLLYNPSISLGASGAILGLSGALPCCLADCRGQVPHRIFRISLLALIPLLAVILYGILFDAGIDAMAHMGGFAWGLYMGFYFFASDEGDRSSAFRKSSFLICRGFAAALLAGLFLILASGALKYEKERVRQGYDDLGKVYFNRCRYDKAVRCFERALVMDPSDGGALMMLGRSYIQNGDIGRGIEVLEELHAREPRNEWAITTLSGIYCMLGGNALHDHRINMALDFFEKSLALDGSHCGALWGKGACMIEEGNYREGAHLWRKSLAGDSRNQAHYRKYRELITLICLIYAFPDNRPFSPARKPLGRAFQLQKEGERALYRKGDFMKALECFHKAVREDPGYSLPYLSIGSIYMVLENCPQAGEYFSRSRDLDGRNGEALIGLGDCALSQGDLEAGERLYRQAALMDPRSGLAWSRLAALHMKTGDRKRARICMDRSRQMDEMNPHHALLSAGIARQYGDESLYFREMTAALALARHQKKAELEEYVLKMLGRD